MERLARRARLDLADPSTRTTVPRQPVAKDPIDLHGLSAREREVLDLLLDGRTNRGIGAALFITEKTASSFVSHIVDELGVTSRGAAAAVAARAGVLGAAGR